MNNSCQCNENETINKKCVICYEEGITNSNTWDKYGACQLHKYKGFYGCGHPEYVCEKCKKLGWISTTGSGGPTRHLNTINFNEKLKNGNIIEVESIQL